MTSNNINFNFISKNVKGLQIFKKLLKVCEYFKKRKYIPSGIAPGRILVSESLINESELILITFYNENTMRLNIEFL